MYSNNRKVLLFAFGVGGGAGKNIVKYANIITSLGYEVRVSAGRCTAKARLAELHPSVNQEVYGATRSLQTVVPLAKTLRKFDPDLVVVVGGSNMVVFQLASLLSNRKPTVLLRETNAMSAILASYPPLKRFIKQRVFSLGYRRANHIIALTKSMASEFQAAWGVPSDQISYIPNGVPVPKVATPVLPKVEVPQLLCVARLSAQKDIATLLKALRIVLQTRECKLRVAGEGPERAALVQLCSELELTSHVEWLGHVDDLASLYSGASLTVLSSCYEGFPNVLIESLAHGTPIVSTDCPTGPEEVVMGFDVGYLAAVGKPDDLAKKILQALDAEFCARTLHQRAMDFSEERVAQSVSTLLSRLFPEGLGATVEGDHKVPNDVL